MRERSTRDFGNFLIARNQKPRSPVKGETVKGATIRDAGGGVYLVGGVPVIIRSRQRRRPPSRELHDQSSCTHSRELGRASRSLRARHRGDPVVSNHACRRRVDARAHARLGKRRERARRRRPRHCRQRARAAAASPARNGAHTSRRRRSSDSLLDRRLHRTDASTRFDFGARLGLRRPPHRLERYRFTWCDRSDRGAALVSERARVAACRRRSARTAGVVPARSRRSAGWAAGGDTDGAGRSCCRQRSRCFACFVPDAVWIAPPRCLSPSVTGAPEPRTGPGRALSLHASSGNAQHSNKHSFSLRL